MSDTQKIQLQLFLDESFRQHYDKQGRLIELERQARTANNQIADAFYYLAGILGTPEQITLLETLLEQQAERIKKNLGITTALEFHCKDISSAMGTQKVDNPAWTAVQQCRRFDFDQMFNDLGTCIRLSGVTPVGMRIDTKRVQEVHGDKAADSYHLTFQYLLERIERYLLPDLFEEHEAKDFSITVTCDPVSKPGAVDTLLAQLLTTGTRENRNTTLHAYQAPIKWVESHQSRALQAADIVAYFIRQHFDPDTLERPEKAKRAASLIHNIGGIQMFRWIARPSGLKAHDLAKQLIDKQDELESTLKKRKVENPKETASEIVHILQKIVPQQQTEKTQ